MSREAALRAKGRVATYQTPGGKLSARQTAAFFLRRARKLEREAAAAVPAVA